MKPSCKNLFSCRNPAILGFSRRNPTKLCLIFYQACQFHTKPSRSSSGFCRVHDEKHRAFSVPNPSLGQSGSIRVGSTGRGISVITNVASNYRKNLSTSVESRVSDSNFERIYVQGGMNVKPLVVERIDEDKSIEGGEALGDENGVLESREEAPSEANVESPKREFSDIENEAWKLLESAVVNYCGSPVGTVAANNPGDSTPLNYDQVFIRDFVPSGLAFLLKGEGEIVRNFLLHTLQLQVNCSHL